MVFSLQKRDECRVWFQVSGFRSVLATPLRCCPETRNLIAKFFPPPTKPLSPTGAGVVRLDCTQPPETFGRGPKPQPAPPSCLPYKGCSCDRPRLPAWRRSDRG